MDNTYVQNLETLVSKMEAKNNTLSIEKEKAESLLKNKQQYIKDVICYLTSKLEESNGDTWQALQDISKLDRKSTTNKNNLIADYVCKKLVAE